MEQPSRAVCPACGARGRPVADETVRALVHAPRVEPLLAVARWFCRTPSCDVVYYGEDGSVAARRDVRVRVGLKETRDPVPLCYCFGFSRADVRRELASGGQCTIPERIAALIKAGRCACALKNPSGACCLGEVNRAVEEEKDGSA